MLKAYIKERLLRELEARLPGEVATVKNALLSECEDQPVKAHCLLILARCYLLEGDVNQSKQTLEALLSEISENIEAKVELAKILHDQDNNPAAIELLTQATNARPEVIENWQLLNEYLHQAGQDEAGKNALAQYDMIKAYNDNLEKAEKAFFNAEYVRADNLCRKLLEQVPGEVRAMRLLARIAKYFRHFEISQSILAPCIQTRPNDAGLGLDYAHSLLACRDFNAVLEQCERLIAFAPEYIDVYRIKAEALYSLARYEEAIEIFREIASVDEHPELSLLHLGKALKTVGKSEDAIDCFHRAINGEPRLGQAYWELASLKTYGFSEDEIESMQEQLTSDGLSPMNKLLLQFALGKALEDSQRFAESFQQYKSANNAYKQIRPYRYTSQNSRHKSFFTRPYFSEHKDGGSDSEAPIFVVGLPRSGSTLVEQILTSHSKVDATSELTVMTTISRDLQGSSLPGKGQYPQSLAALSTNQIQGLAQKYLGEVQQYRLEAPYFVDKAPTNFHHIGLIKTMFPRAKIIDIRRNPMASGWSLYRHFFADSFLFSYDLKTIARYYNDYIELMDHWHTVLPGQILTMSYEQLVADLSANVDTMLQYCNLEFEDACVDFHLNKRAVATPSSEQVRQPIYSDALDHWKNYEEFLLPLRQIVKI